MPNDIIRYFEYKHLPPHLQHVSKAIGDVAVQLDELLPNSAEKSAGLRKLLEAKDCFVRANLPPITANPTLPPHLTVSTPVKGGFPTARFEPPTPDPEKPLHITGMVPNERRGVTSAPGLAVSNREVDINLDLPSGSFGQRTGLAERRDASATPGENKGRRYTDNRPKDTPEGDPNLR